MLALGGPLAAAAGARKPPPGAGLDLTPASFQPISPTLLFGGPVDISAGWDGTLWAIGSSGAPHRYDPLSDTWSVEGTGIDAAAVLGTVIYHFRGDSYVKMILNQNTVLDPGPVAIGATWPKLPYSFTQRVDGAANVNGELYLFRGGLYLDVPSTGDPGPVRKLTDLTSWPTTDAWKDGVIDAVCSNAGGNNGVVQLFRGAEFVHVDLVNRKVLEPPAPISSFADFQHLPADWQLGGVDAAFSFTKQDGTVDGTTAYTFYRGPALVGFALTTPAPPSAEYIGATYAKWPSAWNPVLTEAPSGRVGGLYAPTRDGAVVASTGDDWQPLAALSSGKAVSVSVGRDGSVFAASSSKLHRLTGSTWSSGVAPPAGANLAQVAAGDGTRVWARAANGAVYQLSSSGTSLAPVALLKSARDLDANPDGTVWHCQGDGNAYRLISEGTEPSEQISLGSGGATVQKVTSTGFGTSYCLVDPPGVKSVEGGSGQLYAYTSNYLFKTSQSYNSIGFGTIAQGAGMVFLAVDTSTDPVHPSTSIVGLDDRTGEERLRWPRDPLGYQVVTNPVFDPQNQLLYVGTGGKYVANELYAVDPRTGNIVWEFLTPGSIDAAPALRGTLLCFGDSSGTHYAIDTRQAAANPGIEPDPVWTQPPPAGVAATHVGTPLITASEAVFVTWAGSGSARSLVVTRRSLADGTENSAQVRLPVAAGADDPFVAAPPVAGTTLGADGKTDVPAVFVNAADQIVAIYAGSSPMQWATKTYKNDRSSRFTSGIAFDSGVLWVGDLLGRLYGFDRTLKPLKGTPVQPHGGDEIVTTPLIYTDTKGQTFVLFGTVGPASTVLWSFDPDAQANPQLTSYATGQTRVAQLSQAAPNGVLYAAGATYWDTDHAHPAAGQVFAINAEDAVQGLRDVIVESQLMQDFDDPPAGQPDTAPPPTHARYQTHLTLVDDLKLPRSNESIKIWADETTVISIDGGTPVTIGPGDDDFAVAQTGLDGSVTIATGFVKNDGSDDTDLFASPLRTWAGFMDEHERVIVHTDREFHARLTTATSVASSSDPNYDNPDVVNLHAAQSYDGTNLFTDSERTDNQPKNVADAIKTMTSAVAVNGGSPSPSTVASTGGQGKKNTLKTPPQPPLGAAPNRYLAYPDTANPDLHLPGGVYSPVNVAAVRPAVVQNPVGLSFTSNDDGSGTPTFAKTSHADATMAIDALEADHDWSQTALAAPLLGGSIFTSFWHFIKSAAAKITHIVISIGKDIYAGFRFIWNGASYFFKHPLQALEDVVAAIGAFFTKLAKLAKNVIEAIGVLLHLDEIVKTHTLLRDALRTRMFGDKNNPNDKGWVGFIENNAIPAVQAFFEQTETDITNLLESAANSLDPKGNQPLSSLGRPGSTPATMFNVGPPGDSQPASSHSVACTWALRKVQNGQQQVKFDASGLQSVQLPTVLQDFIDAFVGSLKTDGALHKNLQDAKNGIESLFSVKNATEFVEKGLGEVLNIIALLLDAVLALVSAFVQGLLKVFGDFLTLLFDPDTGWLTRPLHIPIIGALYRHFFKEPLTVLNVVMLVAAIPVTILYRIFSGQYPSKDPALAPSGQLQGLDYRQALRNAFGIVGGLATLAGMLFNVAADTAPQLESDYSPFGKAAKFATFGAMCSAVLIGAAAEPHLLVAEPEPADWIIWGLGFVPAACGLIGLAVGVSFEELGEFLDKLSSVELAVCSIGIVIVASIVFSKKKSPSTVDQVAFAALMLLVIPGIVNPLKYVELIGLVVPALDLWGGLGSAASLFAATGLAWNEPLGAGAPALVPALAHG